MATISKKLSLLTFLSIFLVSCPSASEVSASKKIDPPNYSFVKIFTELNIEQCKAEKNESGVECPIGSYFSTGSGMVADIINGETIVLTAGHVCSSKIDDFVTKYSFTISVMDHSARIHQSHVIKSSYDNSKGSPDICALYVPTLTNVKKIQIAGKPPTIGDELYYIGAPLGVYHNPIAPIFKGIYSGIIDPSSAIATMPAAPGSSGSSVLNINNRIVGILYAVHPSFHHITVITNYYSTIAFINDVKKDFIKQN
tara:strand:+ start:6786 stop:7550 length:765 start_codon:yes stop_codon:yes gene_type:complete